LKLCREFFRDRLGMDANVLSYPNGRFRPGQEPILSRHGVEFAFCATGGAEQAMNFQRLALRRTGIGNEPLSAFIRQLRRLKVLA
jgi:hypothetical protein